jgi:hypothetical protein
VEYPESGLDWEFDLTEAIRWCWRHNASLDFDYLPEDGDDSPTITVAVPLRHPEGGVYRATKRCSTQIKASDVVVEIVLQARERLNLE